MVKQIGKDKMIDELNKARETRKIGISIDPIQGCTMKLFRWRRKMDVNATGKFVDGKFKVVFWDRIK